MLNTANYTLRLLVLVLICINTARQQYRFQYRYPGFAIVEYRNTGNRKYACPVLHALAAAGCMRKGLHLQLRCRAGQSSDLYENYLVN